MIFDQISTKYGIKLIKYASTAVWENDDMMEIDEKDDFPKRVGQFQDACFPYLHFSTNINSQFLGRISANRQ